MASADSKFINDKPPAYDSTWVFPKLKKTNTKWWSVFSSMTIASVGFLSKMFIVWLNKTKVHNREVLIDAIKTRPKGTPIITISNHESCFDDPGLWGVLPLKYVCSTKRIRWALAAHDICFTNKTHSKFFMYGKCIPCVRGGGVFQPAVDACIDKLQLGEWVHVFPEGKVNMAQEYIRFKWGVGRMIYESPVVPIVIPIWHKGMDTVLPNEPPYYLRLGKKVTVNFGQPIDLTELMGALRRDEIPEPDARKVITDRIEKEMEKLRLETEVLHKKALGEQQMSTGSDQDGC